MPVTIRSAVLDDLPVLLAIEQEAKTAAHWRREQYARLVESEIVLVTEDGGNISGFVCAKSVAGDWEIENMVVAKQGRRRGLAMDCWTNSCAASGSKLCCGLAGGARIERARAASV